MGKWVGAGDAPANRGSVLTGVTNSGSRHPQAPTLGAARLAAHLLLRLLVATLAAESVGRLDHAAGRVAPVAFVNDCPRVDSLHHACIRTVM